MTDAKLKSYVDRIERLEEERKAIGSDVRDIYAEAKGNRYNPKALRKIIAMRKQKPDPVVDADVEAYKAALGMAVEMVSNGDVSLRKAAKATGVSKSSIHRALAVPAVSHKLTEVDSSGDDAGHRSEPSRPAEQSVNAGPPPGSDEPHRVTAKGDKPAPITETAPDTPPSPAPEFGVGPGTNPAPRHFESFAEQPVSNAADVPTREDGRAGERDPEDDLVIPHFLRRVPG